MKEQRPDICKLSAEVIAVTAGTPPGRICALTSAAGMISSKDFKIINNNQGVSALRCNGLAEEKEQCPFWRNHG